MDPLAGTPWSSTQTVEGFSKGEPNRVLVNYAAAVLAEGGPGALAVDIGCGAGRNAVPLERLGWRVLGIDLSLPMLHAATNRARTEAPGSRLNVALAPMDALPVASRSADLIVAHGIWNLASSSDEMRRAMSEAARVAKPNAALFVFTFSRNTLAPDAEPVPGESFVFTQFAGNPQCFLTESELIEELAGVGFERDAAVPVTEYNRPVRGMLRSTGGPVIYEAAFRFTGSFPGGRPLRQTPESIRRSRSPRSRSSRA
jgi:SAM-dependent methyltransferase